MRALLIAGLLAASSAISATPDSDYMIHCMGCHLADGQGMPPDVPRFDEALLALAATDRGRTYLVQVPGASQSPLTDEELAAVINWVLQEYAGHDFTRFSGAEVSGYRGRPMLNPAVVRAGLVDR